MQLGLRSKWKIGRKFKLNNILLYLCRLCCIQLIDGRTTKKSTKDGKDNHLNDAKFIRLCTPRHTKVQRLSSHTFATESAKSDRRKDAHSPVAFCILCYIIAVLLHHRLH